jgi:hypothetical protein
MSEESLLSEGRENKKPRKADEGGCRAFSLLSNPSEGTRAKRAILPPLQRKSPCRETAGVFYFEASIKRSLNAQLKK